MVTTEIPLSIGISAKNLDVIVVVVVVVGGGHGDNRGTSFNWHFSVKPTISSTFGGIVITLRDARGVE